MKMISIPKVALLALAGLLTATAFTQTASASEQVCMNTGNGNGGSIAYYPYLFNNNTFGWSNDKGAPYSCLTLNYTNGSSGGSYYDGFGASWDWPENGSPYSVKAYPSVVYGWQYGYTYSGLGLPTRVWNNTSVPTYQSTSLYSSGFQYEDVLLDNWLLATPNQTSGQAGELEIFTTNSWNAYQDGVNNSKKYGYMTVDGVYYVISPGYNGWPVYNFVPNDSSNNVTASPNIKDFVNVMCYDYGAFSNSLYLAGTQVGVEIYYGTGGVTFNPVAVSAN